MKKHFNFFIFIILVLSISSCNKKMIEVEHVGIRDSKIQDHHFIDDKVVYDKIYKVRAMLNDTYHDYNTLEFAILIKNSVGNQFMEIKEPTRTFL